LGYDEIVDFTMSEKFGLDWQKQMTVQRVAAFIAIIQAQQERLERDNKKGVV